MFEGVYYPGGSRSASFELKDGVAIYGGFDDPDADDLGDRNPDPLSNDTFLSGAILTSSDDDNSYHVVTGVEVGSGTILDGFTIEDGYAFDTENPMGDPPTWGAGIYLIDSHAVIRNCHIRDCIANEGAGAVVISSDPEELVSAPTFEDVRFFGNNAKYRGTGLLAIESSPAVSRAYF